MNERYHNILLKVFEEKVTKRVPAHFSLDLLTSGSKLHAIEFSCLRL